MVLLICNLFLEEKSKMLSEHSDRLFKCQGAAHRIHRAQVQNAEELAAFDSRRREQIISNDKHTIKLLDAKVSFSYVEAVFVLVKEF